MTILKPHRTSTFFLRLLLIAIFIAPGVYGQSNNVSDGAINYKINSDRSATPIEKAYLQFDKPYYAIGDTIYYKAYITIGAEHKLSALSGILYVDLIGPDNKIARSEKLQMVAGITWGDFMLPDTLQGGNYRIRAYTNWMRNEGEASFFERTIPVGKYVEKKIAESAGPVKAKKSGKDQPQKMDFQFLPEGGRLITGNYSRIAFKAIGPDGLGRNVTGTVTDETGVEICKFENSHAGLGSFNIVPQTGKVYKANLTYNDGTTAIIDLPKAVNSGYTMALNNNDADTIRIRITGGAENNIQGLKLEARLGGTVYYAAENQSTGKFFSAKISKRQFPTGVVQFTLLSAAGEPLNERLAFINNNDALKFNSTGDKKIDRPRQKINTNIKVIDKDNHPVTGSFSVAVIDEDKVPVDSLNEHTILTDILLNSELKGTIEQPGYYFAKDDEKTRADLDLLMLTQGYRTFSWRPASAKEQPVYEAEKSIKVSGKVTKWNKPAVGAKVTLYSNKGGFFMIDTVTDKNGRFEFNNLVFTDSTKFVVQSKVPKGQDAVTLELDTILPPQLKPTQVNSLTVTLNNDANVSSYAINQQQFYEEQQKYGINKHPLLLKEVKVEAKYQPKIPHSQNLNGPGNADQVITASDIERFICGKLSDCLTGVLIGVRFTNGVPNVAVFIDGTLTDPEVFAELRPDDIEGIEYLRFAHYQAVYGSRAANGALIVTTKPARRVNNFYRYAPGVVTCMPKGFYKAREFYSPQYDNPHTNQKMADLRSTIYWNPNIITDKDGKASFSYFNADGKGTYRVVIEGIDADGNLGRQVYRYKVE